jgi:hypothetical protein
MSGRLACHDAEEIETSELDEPIDRCKRAAQKLWSFCAGGGFQILQGPRSVHLV